MNILKQADLGKYEPLLLEGKIFFDLKRFSLLFSGFGVKKCRDCCCCLFLFCIVFEVMALTSMRNQTLDLFK